MADQKVESMTENTSPAKEDLLYTVADPISTPVDRRVTVGNAMKLAPHWVDRIPSAWDWAVGDLTVDNAYHDLDLSSIVSVGATRVRVNLVYNPNSASARNIYLRQKDRSYTTFNYYTPNWDNAEFNLEFPMDSTRRLEYKISDTVGTFSLAVTGWYIDTVTNTTTTTTV